jgi:hypothetical protein
MSADAPAARTSPSFKPRSLVSSISTEPLPGNRDKAALVAPVGDASCLVEAGRPSDEGEDVEVFGGAVVDEHAVT